MTLNERTAIRMLPVLLALAEMGGAVPCPVRSVARTRAEPMVRDQQSQNKIDKRRARTKAAKKQRKLQRRR